MPSRVQPRPVHADRLNLNGDRLPTGSFHTGRNPRRGSITDLGTAAVGRTASSDSGEQAAGLALNQDISPSRRRRRQRHAPDQPRGHDGVARWMTLREAGARRRNYSRISDNYGDSLETAERPSRAGAAAAGPSSSSSDVVLS